MSNIKSPKLLVILEAIGLICLLISTILVKAIMPTPEEVVLPVKKVVVTSPKDEEIKLNDYKEEKIKFSEAVEAKIAQMDNMQMVAQLFMVSPEAITGVDRVTVFGNTSKDSVLKYPVGGLVYQKENFSNQNTAKNLLANTKTFYKEQFGISLFAAIEEIGGDNNSPIATMMNVNRIKLPNSLGKGGDTSAVRTADGNRNAYLKEIGFNTILGAYAEAAVDYTDPIKNFCFSSDYDTALEMVETDIQAVLNDGMYPIARSFPFTSSDLGKDLRSNQSISDLFTKELMIWQEVADLNCTFLMVSNNPWKKVTSDEKLPSDMSGKVVSLLRDEMGYDGILITSELNQKNITDKYSSADAAVNAINAGMDMIYCPQDFVEAYNAVLEAVEKGTISQDRLHNAVGRILSAKIV